MSWLVLFVETCWIRGPVWLAVVVLGEDVAWGKPKLMSVMAEMSLLRGSNWLEVSKSNVSKRADEKFWQFDHVYVHTTMTTTKGIHPAANTELGIDIMGSCIVKTLRQFILRF